MRSRILAFLGLLLALAILAVIGHGRPEVLAQEMRSGNVSTYISGGHSLVEWGLPDGVRCYVSEVEAISCILVPGG